MAIFRYGKWHVSFAWRPVDVAPYGRRWLCRVWRRRWYADVLGAPKGWDYLPMRVKAPPHGERVYLTPVDQEDGV